MLFHSKEGWCVRRSAQQTLLGVQSCNGSRVADTSLQMCQPTMFGPETTSLLLAILLHSLLEDVSEEVIPRTAKPLSVLRTCVP